MSSEQDDIHVLNKCIIQVHTVLNLLHFNSDSSLSGYVLQLTHSWAIALIDVQHSHEVSQFLGSQGQEHPQLVLSD